MGGWARAVRALQRGSRRRRHYLDASNRRRPITLPLFERRDRLAAFRDGLTRYRSAHVACTGARGDRHWEPPSVLSASDAQLLAETRFRVRAIAPGHEIARRRPPPTLGQKVSPRQS